MTTTAAPPRWRTVLAFLALRDEPFWIRTIPRRIVRVFLIVVYANVGALIVLLALENRLLYPGSSFAEGWADPAPGNDIQDIELISRDGNTIHAWWAQVAGWKPADRAILYSHGNGGNLSMREWNITEWRKTLQKPVLIYDYPGYGKSTGRPTEAGCYAASDAAYDWLVDQQKVPPSQLILIGSSLGAAMSVDLAARRHHRA